MSRASLEAQYPQLLQKYTHVQNEFNENHRWCCWSCCWLLLLLLCCCCCLLLLLPPSAAAAAASCRCCCLLLLLPHCFCTGGTTGWRVRNALRQAKRGWSTNWSTRSCLGMRVGPHRWIPRAPLSKGFACGIGELIALAAFSRLDPSPDKFTCFCSGDMSSLVKTNRSF